MKRGRPVGSLARFMCHFCKEVERVRGGSHKFVCSSCRAKDCTLRFGGSFRDNGKDLASMIVQRARKDGLLPSPNGMPCTDCGGAALEYEHRDYNKPLEVDPVCRSCNLKRGPGRPKFGFFRKAFENKHPPYRRKADMERLFALLNVHVDLSDVPSRVRFEHWQPFREALLSVDRPKLRAPDPEPAEATL